MSRLSNTKLKAQYIFLNWQGVGGSTGNFHTFYFFSTLNPSIIHFPFWFWSCQICVVINLWYYGGLYDMFTCLDLRAVVFSSRHLRAVVPSWCHILWSASVSTKVQILIWSHWFIWHSYFLVQSYHLFCLRTVNKSLENLHICVFFCLRKSLFPSIWIQLCWRMFLPYLEDISTVALWVLVF